MLYNHYNHIYSYGNPYFIHADGSSKNGWHNACSGVILLFGSSVRHFSSRSLNLHRFFEFSFGFAIVSMSINSIVGTCETGIILIELCLQSYYLRRGVHLLSHELEVLVKVLRRKPPLFYHLIAHLPLHPHYQLQHFVIRLTRKHYLPSIYLK